jgi:hypothetical protein
VSAAELQQVPGRPLAMAAETARAFMCYAAPASLLALLRRRTRATSPIKPEPNSQAAAGIGTTLAPLANPVIDWAPGLASVHPFAPFGMQAKK